MRWRTVTLKSSKFCYRMESIHTIRMSEDSVRSTLSIQMMTTLQRWRTCYNKRCVIMKVLLLTTKLRQMSLRVYLYDEENERICYTKTRPRQVYESTHN